MFINRSKTSENTQGSSTLATNQSLSTEVKHWHILKFYQQKLDINKFQSLSNEVKRRKRLKVHQQKLNTSN